MPEQWYQIEEEVPARQSLSLRPYWTALWHEGHPWRCPDEGEAVAVFRRVLEQGRTVRLVRVTEEVVAVVGTFEVPPEAGCPSSRDGA